MRKQTTMLVSLVAVMVFAGSASAFWFITDMFDQPSKKPQEGMPIPLPEMSVPVNGAAYPVTLVREELAPMLPENPYAGQTSGEVMVAGKKMYDTYCAVCHGPTGMGDGPVAAANKGIPPFPLLGVGRFSDQEIFAQVWSGNGAIMGPYYWAMTEDEIWQVVNYVRSFTPQ